MSLNDDETTQKKRKLKKYSQLHYRKLIPTPLLIWSSSMEAGFLRLQAREAAAGVSTLVLLWCRRLSRFLSECRIEVMNYTRSRFVACWFHAIGFVKWYKIDYERCVFFFRVGRRRWRGRGAKKDGRAGSIWRTRGTVSWNGFKSING